MGKGGRHLDRISCLSASGAIDLIRSGSSQPRGLLVGLSVTTAAHIARHTTTPTSVSYGIRRTLLPNWGLLVSRNLGGCSWGWA